ncbi:SH3 domain-containing protein [Telluria aromaticivorans]|uniref:SH3 domain-containing protein n=1 Tax=Telluria aromaticivorans TaxID=2725995 RepID=A0A7Y2NZK8_9BURK|nr:SH3 domain-containing protein [Telluria aromaticivorans]NNG23233.1 SH3 domain-containing protein [Telluria aromaticivorans]
MSSTTSIALYAAGLLLTLCLAAWLTPRTWWRRPNARALTVLACGTALLGALLHGLFGPPAIVHAAAPAEPERAADTPVAGERYRVRDDLNLRAAAGVNAARLAVVPAGTQVTATGHHEGDWWKVSADVEGKKREGWASSLWLRRRQEGS